MPPRLIRQGLLLALLLVAWLFAGDWILRRGLLEEGRLGVERLGIMTGALLQKAHHAKDDLALETAVQAMAQVPGLSIACVIDESGKILAHSQVSLLGKRVQTLPSGVQAWPLQGDKGVWGTLLFHMFDSHLRHIGNMQLGVQTLGFIFLWGGFVIWSILWERQVVQGEAARNEQEALLAEEKSKIVRLERQIQDFQVAGLLRLQSAIDQVVGPLILLDERQRVMVMNQTAALKLGSENRTRFAGKSWHELPLLQPCGTAIERSLAFPGQEVAWPETPQGLRLTFKTDPESVGSTWIFLL